MLTQPMNPMLSERPISSGTIKAFSRASCRRGNGFLQPLRDKGRKDSHITIVSDQFFAPNRCEIQSRKLLNRGMKLQVPSPEMSSSASATPAFMSCLTCDPKSLTSVSPRCGSGMLWASANSTDSWFIFAQVLESATVVHLSSSDGLFTKGPGAFHTWEYP